MKEKPRKIIQICPPLVPSMATGTGPKLIQKLHILVHPDALRSFSALPSALLQVPGLCFRLAAGKLFSAHKQKINSAETGRTTTGILRRLKKLNFLWVIRSINILQNSFSTVA